MQRIEIPKGAMVTIEDGVILIDTAEKRNSHPANGEIVVVEFDNRKLIAIYTSDSKKYNVACCYSDEKTLTWTDGDIFLNHHFKAASNKEASILTSAILNAGYRYNEETHDVEKVAWEPKVGEIVKMSFLYGSIVLFYTERRGNCIATGFDMAGRLRIRSLGVHDGNLFSPTSQEEKNRLLTALADAGYKYNEETHDVEKIAWEPKVGKRYWTFDSYEVFSCTRHANSFTDAKIIKNKFAFKTEREAQEFFNQVKELAKKR